MRLLTAKYIPESNILQSTIPKGSSYSWQSINRAATLLKPGYIVQVGQGDVSLWYERWLHNGRLCDRVPYVELHDMHLKFKTSTMMACAILNNFGPPYPWILSWRFRVSSSTIIHKTLLSGNTRRMGPTQRRVPIAGSCKL